jgi:hypothetical protein
VSDRPQAMALLAALCHDLAGIRAQLDRLSDDELSVLPGAIRDVAIELRFTLIDRGCDLAYFPVSDAWCDGSVPARRCPAPDCDRALPSTRSHYCSGRCRMRVLRQRRLLASLSEVVEMGSPPVRRPLDHYVYECGACDERYLGVRRCGLCRRRHKPHYADLAVMPSWPVPRVGAAA